jgi:hypothetical protein
MSQGKKVAFVTNARLVPATEIWPMAGRSMEGKFVLKAVMVADKPKAEDGQDNHRVFMYGEEIRTTILVHIDHSNQEYESQNTIYKVVPESEVDAYRMCVPT